MPCTYYLPGEEEALQAKALNLATRVACEIAKHGKPVTQEAKDWIAAHEQMDAARKKAEEENEFRSTLRQHALNKLTPSERAALGVS